MRAFERCMLRTRFVPCTASGGCFASLWARWCASSIRVFDSMTRVAKPSSTAVAGDMRSPVNRYSRNLISGPNSGQKAAPPSPATNPTETWGSAKCARSETSTMSHSMAMLQPSPTAAPFTAATTGSGNRSISSMISAPSRILSYLPAGSVANELNQSKSPPAQKVLPAPVKITTRASRSAESLRHTFASAQCRAGFTAFSCSGRLMVTIRTGPSEVTTSSDGRASSISAVTVLAPRAHPSLTRSDVPPVVSLSSLQSTEEATVLVDEFQGGRISPREDSHKNSFLPADAAGSRNSDSSCSTLPRLTSRGSHPSAPLERVLGSDSSADSPHQP